MKISINKGQDGKYVISKIPIPSCIIKKISNEQPNEFVFTEIFIYVVEIDCNPEYTPELRYRIYLTETQAFQDVHKNPECLRPPEKRKCPSCLARIRKYDLVWKEKEWIIGSDEKGIWIQDKSQPQEDWNDRENDEALDDSLTFHDYECPRCEYWKRKLK